MLGDGSNCQEGGTGPGEQREYMHHLRDPAVLANELSGLRVRVCFTVIDRGREAIAQLCATKRSDVAEYIS